MNYIWRYAYCVPSLMNFNITIWVVVTFLLEILCVSFIAGLISDWMNNNHDINDNMKNCTRNSIFLLHSLEWTTLSMYICVCCCQQQYVLHTSIILCLNWRYGSCLGDAANILNKSSPKMSNFQFFLWNGSLLSFIQATHINRLFAHVYFQLSSLYRPTCEQNILC